MHILKELQPTDSYEIRLPHHLSTYERQIVTMFYQPIIGANAVTMYLTMWTEAEFETSPQVHYYLMNVLGQPLQKIFETRAILEAIGLLRTFKRQDANGRHFLYEIVRPLGAEQFFNDPLLSMFLFSKIGEQPYRKLRTRFLRPQRDAQYEEVTRSFIDVFTPVHANMPSDVTAAENQPKQEAYPFHYADFDFNMLRVGLSEQLVPSSALTPSAKIMITKLAFLYELTPIDMQKVVLAALDEHNHLTDERLKKEAKEYYKVTVSKKAPQLQKRVEIPTIEAPTQPETKEEKRHRYWQTTPPVQVLRDFSGGNDPMPTSLELVENLVLDYGMEPAVVNALVEYVMLTTDMKLPRKYVQTIADHWRRKNVQTTQQAMELARKEHEQYKGWKEKAEVKATTSTQSTGRKYTNRREEKLPDWFETRHEQKDEQLTTQQEEELAAARKRMLQKLGLDDGEVNE